MSKEQTQSLPEPFLEQMKSLLGQETPSFIQALTEASEYAIRVNTKKILEHNFTDNVPWTKHGFYAGKAGDFVADPLWHAGAYYVQESSSMFLEQIIHQFLPKEENSIVLDLCAAPGGKSTHLLSLLNEDSLLVSNEIIGQRVKILKENITKWGSIRSLITQNDPVQLGRMTGLFNAILIDAPCSGEGLFRKDPQACNEWSIDSVQHCASRQKRIIADIWPALQEDGLLIYSTCTYNKVENEESLDWMIENYHVEPLRVQLQPEWGVVETQSEKGAYGYHFYPHKVRGEGFFISVLRKTSEEKQITLRRHKKSNVAFLSRNDLNEVAPWVNTTERHAFMRFKDTLLAMPESLAEIMGALSDQLHVIQCGSEVFETKRKGLVPQHGLAMNGICSSSVPSIELDDQQVIDYLKRVDLQLAISEGDWLLCTYKQIPLGWIKRVGNRFNNYYPQEWKIRMDVLIASSLIK